GCWSAAARGRLREGAAGDAVAGSGGVDGRSAGAASTTVPCRISRSKPGRAAHQATAPTTDRAAGATSATVDPRT
ncbi:MAG: hypothetical protein WBQ93_14495, partial [Candidatus Competibacter sp.]